MKTTTLPKHAPDPITALLRARPDALRSVLKAFGWTFHGTHGWRCGIWLGERSRFAILDLRTLAWRVGPEGKRDTWRGWLAESFHWCLRARGVPKPEHHAHIARMIQNITGPWPALQAECERQRTGVQNCTGKGVPNGTHSVRNRTVEPGAAFSTTEQMAKTLTDGLGFTPKHNKSNLLVINNTDLGAPPTLNPEAASGLIEPGGSEGVTPLHPPLLECHGWPYEPDQAPNVVTFLRPWNGPRGGGAA